MIRSRRGLRVLVNGFLCSNGGQQRVGWACLAGRMAERGTGPHAAAQMEDFNRTCTSKLFGTCMASRLGDVHFRHSLFPYVYIGIPWEAKGKRGTRPKKNTHTILPKPMGEQIKNISESLETLTNKISNPMGNPMQSHSKTNGEPDRTHFKTNGKSVKNLTRAIGNAAKTF